MMGNFIGVSPQLLYSPGISPSQLTLAATKTRKHKRKLSIQRDEVKDEGEVTDNAEVLKTPRVNERHSRKVQPVPRHSSRVVAMSKTDDNTASIETPIPAAEPKQGRSKKSKLLLKKLEHKDQGSSSVQLATLPPEESQGRRLRSATYRERVKDKPCSTDVEKKENRNLESRSSVKHRAKKGKTCGSSTISSARSKQQDDKNQERISKCSATSEAGQQLQSTTLDPVVIEDEPSTSNIKRKGRNSKGKQSVSTKKFPPDSKKNQADALLQKLRVGFVSNKAEESTSDR